VKSFQSLAVTDDIWSPIPDTNQRGQFQSFFASLESDEDKELKWEKLQKQVEQIPQLGPYWQFLALQEGRTKIYGTTASEAKNN
jgi:hypothetical protein